MRIKKMTGIMEDAQMIMSNDAFQKVASLLNVNSNNVREEIQTETSTEIKRIINKLKENKPITSEELELIKLWIVGDADSYIKMENNLQDWQEEFNRLKFVLSEYENKECSVTDLFKLQGILQDAIRVAYDIALFLESKERISKFESATSDMANINKNALINVLSGKLQSPDY